MDGVARFQREGRDLDVEPFAARADHLVSTPHYTGGGLEGAPGRVLERLAGRQDGLLADHARPFYFFDVLQGIGDDPVAADELYRVASLVCDADGVLENPFALQRPGIFGRVSR